MKNKCAMRLPSEKNKFMKLKNFKNQIKVPFVIHADSECLLEPILNDYENNMTKTTIYQKYIPSSVGYYLECSYDEGISAYDSERGENCIKWFVDKLKKTAEKVGNILDNPKSMKITEEQEKYYNLAEKCHVCNNEFSQTDKEVRDYDHLTRDYRGAAHQGCHINYTDSCVIPVAIHNLSGYDAHFFIKILATQIPGKVDLLPLNKENYISFTEHIEGSKIQFRFIDLF